MRYGGYYLYYASAGDQTEVRSLLLYIIYPLNMQPNLVRKIFGVMQGFFFVVNSNTQDF